VILGLRAASDGTLPTAKRLVPEILDNCPVKTIRAFFRKSWRYMDAYRCVLISLNLFLLIAIAGKASMLNKPNMQSRNIGPIVQLALKLL